MSAATAPVRPASRRRRRATRRGPRVWPQLRLDRVVTPEVRVRRWSFASGAVDLPEDIHPHVELAWVASGSVSYRIGRRDLVGAAGQAIVVPVGVDHSERVSAGTEVCSIWLGRRTVEEVAAAMGQAVPRDGLHIRTTRVGSLCGLLAEEARAPGPGQTLAVNALAEALSVELVRHAARETPAPAGCDARIARAVEKVRSDFRDALSVDDLAAAAGLSRYHFSRMFGRQMGVSPYRFLLRTRVEHAAELLRNGRYSVTEAAFASGFSDLGRFRRAFKKLLGRLPSAT